MAGTNKDVEFDGRGFSKDIEFDKEKNLNKSTNNNNSDEACGTVMGFISKIQEVSVQEALLDGSIDKNLFTLQKTYCALKKGFYLGLSTSITILMHIIFCFFFSFYEVLSFFEGKEESMLVFKYFPALVTIIVTIYIANFSKYAVGDFTAKAIKTFYIGKMFSTISAGLLLFMILSFINANINSFHLSRSFEYAKQMFISDINAIYFETIFLVLLSSFLPFLFYGFRKIFFNTDEQSEYEKY